MSIEMVNYVWNTSKHSGSALLTLLAIADYAGDDGRAWPSIDTLCKKTRLSERQTIRILKKLEGSGELGVDHRRNIGNIYTVITDIMTVSNPITDIPDITSSDTTTPITDTMESVDPLVTSNKVTKLTNYGDKDPEIEAFLQRVPESTRGLAEAFCYMHGRSPTQNEERYWRKCWNEQLKIGLTSDLIVHAYRYMDKNSLTVKSPQSLNAVAERIKREDHGFMRIGHIEDGVETIELGDVRYPAPKSKTVNQ